MAIHSFHLVQTGLTTTARALVRPPTEDTVPGLRRAECMTTMRLGAPVVSPARLQVHRLAMFAAWDDEAALDRFLTNTPLGRACAGGWHVRLDFLRRWGHISEFDGLPETAEHTDPNEPVVAVTLARLKLTQTPRFIAWGKPVEQLVRDDPNTTLALAAMRPHHTVSTFSIWRSAQAMTDMVAGHSEVPGARRHIDAMAERERKDFHHEFTTLRFRCRGEYGEWDGRGDFVPVTNRA